MAAVTEQITPTPQPRPAWKRPLAIGAIATVLFIVFVAVGISIFLRQRTLALRDPEGARACNLLASWQRGEVKQNRLVIATALADQAAKASTESIRKTAGEPVFDGEMMKTLEEAGYSSGNFRFADLGALNAACVTEGVSMPPWAG